MERLTISQRTKIRILHRDDYTCKKCGFKKVHTMIDVPCQFKTSFEMFVLFKDIVTSDRCTRTLKFVDIGGDINDIVFEWQSTDNIEIDHNQAVCNGGTESDSNLQCLCKKCHRLKTDRDLLELSKKRSGFY